MTESTKPTRKKQFRTRAAIIIAVLGVGGFAAYSLLQGGKSGSLEDLPVAVAGRGPLRISVLERGNLRAKKTTTIRSELEGESKLLHIVPEGKNVKSGELLIELDVSQQTERRVQQRISYDTAEASYIDAKEQLAIRENQSESNIKKAELTLDLANTSLKKYIEGDFPQKKQTQESKIKIAEQQVTQARERYEWSKRLLKEGYLTKTEYERDELEVNRAEIDVELSKRDLQLLTTYERPMEEKKLAAAVDEAVRELERVKRQALAEKAQAEANLRAKSSTLELEKEKLKKLETQISKSKIFAPTDGVVVYATQGGGGRRQEEMITIGARVSEREELMELPDPSRMIAEAKFHESVIDMIRTGQTAVVTVDSAPDKPMPARVSYLSVVPDSGSRWMNPDLKVYRAEVEIEASTGEFKPQMSCAIEIVVEDIADAIFVPVQSVFRRGGRPVCYVPNGGAAVPRNVELGKTNDRNVQILKGIDAGEKVLLALPPGMESELTAEAPKTRVGEVVDPTMNPAAATPGPGGPRRESTNNEGERRGGPGGPRGPGNRPSGPGKEAPGGKGAGDGALREKAQDGDR